MPDPNLPVACDLGQLGPEERRRERELLARFRTLPLEVIEAEDAFRYVLPADAATLAAVAELLAYERLCCPFLEFRLRVTAAAGAELEIAGSPLALDLVRTEFGGAR